MILVMNIRNVPPLHKRPERTMFFYIGRNIHNAIERNLLDATVLGNPYHIGVDGNREEVVAKYEVRIEKDDNVSSNINVLLNKLASISKEVDIVLVCHCAPLACHGDVLKKKILSYVD